MGTVQAELRGQGRRSGRGAAARADASPNIWRKYRQERLQRAVLGCKDVRVLSLSTLLHAISSSSPLDSTVAAPWHGLVDHAEDACMPETAHGGVFSEMLHQLMRIGGWSERTANRRCCPPGGVVWPEKHPWQAL